MTKFISYALTITVLLAACVTINIYFPEAEAEAAADRIIDEVRGESASGEPTGRLTEPLHYRVAAVLLEALVPAAHAQGRPNFDATSPATRQLEASLKARFAELKPYYDSGAIGLTAEGTIEIRDRAGVPLNERNRVRQLVSEQNADWEALYKELARINGQPAWEEEIRAVFAERWVAKADPGWYYRDANGNWKQK